MLPKITYFDMYLRKLGYGDYFKIISDLDGSGASCEIFPTELCTDDKLNEMYAIRDTYDWDNPSFWVPKISEFKQSMFGVLPALGKISLAPVLLAPEDNLDNILLLWNAFLSNRPEWLTQDVIDSVDTIAVECKIELK